MTVAPDIGLAGLNGVLLLAALLFWLEAVRFNGRLDRRLERILTLAETD